MTAPSASLFLEAIALRKCIDAAYNRTSIVLAPHILYTRHDELYVDAITILRDGYPPKEVKLGSFKLAGLRDARLVERPFERNRLFDPDEPRYAGTTLFVVEGD